MRLEAVAPKTWEMGDVPDGHVTPIILEDVLKAPRLPDDEIDARQCNHASVYLMSTDPGLV